MDRLTRDHIRVIEADYCKHLKEHADKLAAALADAAGYLSSVRTDRKLKDQFGEVYLGQTEDWAAGAKEIAERANALLEEHDERAAQDASARNVENEAKVN